MSSIALRCPKIALLPDSIRAESFHTNLVAAAEEAVKNLGALTTVVDLAQFELTVYNQDVEANCDPDGQLYSTFSGKSALVPSRSPGPLGGMRILNPHHKLLTYLGANAPENSLAIGGAFNAFNEEGSLADEKEMGMLEGAVETLFKKALDDANRDANCNLVRRHIEGDYGTINVRDIE